jgi:DNA (cytosine-5)-methyltransferase 1
VPTIRKRFFGVMPRRTAMPSHWPERTHAPRKDAKQLGLKPWIGAHTIIDWSLPVKSIFGRKKPLAEATLRRTARGVMRYVVDAAKPFIVPITHAGGDRVHDADDPLRTLTTAHRGEMSVVAPTLIRTDQQSAAKRTASNLSKNRSIRFTHHRARSWARPSLVRAACGNRRRATWPSRSAQRQARKIACLSPRIWRSSTSPWRRHACPSEPLDTVMAGAPRHAVVAASLIQSGYGERAGQAPRVLDLEEPAGTQVRRQQGGAGGGLPCPAQHRRARALGGRPGLDHRDARLNARRRGREPPTPVRRQCRRRDR